MAVWSSKDRLYIAYQTPLERQGSSLFQNADGTPLFPPNPPPQPLHPRAYPDRGRLIAAAEIALRVLGAPVEHRTDQWGRFYVVTYGAFGDTAIRNAGNRVAEALGLGTTNEPWTAEEELRSLYKELDLNEDGEDVYLSDGVYLSKDGQLHRL